MNVHYRKLESMKRYQRDVQETKNTFEIGKYRNISVKTVLEPEQG